MATRVEITNHPKTAIILELEKLTIPQKCQLADKYIELVNPNDIRNLYLLIQDIGTIRDSSDFTTINAGTEILLHGQIQPGRHPNNYPHRLEDDESAIIFRRLTTDINNPRPYLTVSRLKK